MTALSALKGRLAGYLDVGWFAVGGDGSGLRTDPAAIYYPQYSYAAPWIFLGDPLSVAGRLAPRAGVDRAVTRRCA